MNNIKPATVNMNAEVSKLRRDAGSKSIEAFASIYLEPHIKHEPSAAHKEIFKQLFDMTGKRGQKCVVAAPRGFGKSTMITFAYALFSICYQREKFIVIVSCIKEQAIQILENIKRELVENPLFATDFPEIFERNGYPNPPRWTLSEIETRNGVKVLAVGSGQSIRGRRHGKDRPTLVIGDDLEPANGMFSPEQRDKMKIWFNKSLLKMGTEITNYILIGTVYHPECFLAEYLDPEKNPVWTRMRYKGVLTMSNHPGLWGKWSKIFHFREQYNGASGPESAKQFYNDNKIEMDEGCSVLWDRWSYYDLMILKEEDPISFQSEIQNEPIDYRNAMFNPDNFRYWDDKYSSVQELLNALPGDVTICGACDPSLGMDYMKGDYSAIVLVAQHYGRVDDEYYVIGCDIRRRDIDELMVDILSYGKKLGINRFGIETNQFQEVFYRQVQDQSYHQGVSMSVERITNTVNKIKRVQGLQILINSGKLFFSKKDQMLLDQLKQFPHGKFDDGPDALAMAIEVAVSLPIATAKAI